MQDLSITLEGLEAIVPIGWDRDPKTGYVARTAVATYRVQAAPIKGSPENTEWTVTIDHRQDDWRSVRMVGEDPAAMLARASRQFKDNMKITRLP